jgi:serine/threonine protein kinase
MNRVLGQGGTSVLVEGVDVSTGRSHAIKVLSSSDFEQKHLSDQLATEVELAGQLNDDHVCKFFDVIREGDLVFIVMEKYDGGDLFSLVADHLLHDKQETIQVFKQILEGVKYLHSRGCSHGDIKLENVVLDKSGNARLIDFGYAKRKQIGDDNDKAGTLLYAAPEMLRRGSFNTQKADIWSLGILLYVMATGGFPYATLNERFVSRAILQGRLLFSQALDPEIERLIRRLTAANANLRPTIDEVLEDPMFTHVGAAGEKPGNGDLEGREIEDEMEAVNW